MREKLAAQSVIGKRGAENETVARANTSNRHYDNIDRLIIKVARANTSNRFQRENSGKRG